MRSLIVLVCLCYSLVSFSKVSPAQPKFEKPSVYEVIPLNSPVRGSVARFSLKLPPGFEIDKIKVKLVNSHDLKKDQKKFSDISITNNNELAVGVSKLPPGFYRLYVTVIDKKSKQEHEFKTNYHDFVRFIIDETMEVPMPDSKKNNVTLAGVDSDGDGIRDDIQRWINENYANKPNTKLALKQFAQSLQKLMTDTIDRESTKVAMARYDESYSCLSWVNQNEASKLLDKLNVMSVNSELRVKHDIKVGSLFHGGSTPDSVMYLPRELEHTLCDFPAQKEQ